MVKWEVESIKSEAPIELTSHDYNHMNMTFEDVNIACIGFNNVEKHVQNEINIKEMIKKRRQYIIDKLCSNVTLHGLRYLGEETGIRKCVWITIMIVAILLSCILFFNTILEFPTQSITEFAVEKNLDKLEYPTITVCNSNSPVYAINAYHNFPVNITFEQFIKFYNSIISHESTRFKNLLSPKVVSYIIDELHLMNYTSYKEIQELFEKHKSDDFFDNIIEAAVKWFKCQYDGKNCEIGNFTQTLHWELSMCQQFNWFKPNGKSLTTNKYGHPHGLMLITNGISRGFYASVPVNGLAFFIHPYGVPHHLIKYTVSVFAQPGSWTQIEIETTEVIFRSYIILHIPRLIHAEHSLHYTYV